jgi:hypothetical protein
VSSTGFGSGRPSRAAVTKEQSKCTLCPTSTEPSTNRSKSGMTSEIGGAPLTMRSVIPVRRATKGSILRPGLTSVANSSTTSPRTTFRAPSSVIAPPFPAEDPVVSRSKTT